MRFRAGAGDVFANLYEIPAHLGRGGMGAVYRVRDMQSESQRALKVHNVMIRSDGRVTLLDFGVAGGDHRDRRDEVSAIELSGSQGDRTADSLNACLPSVSSHSAPSRNRRTRSRLPSPRARSRTCG
jgi:serine/threonine protein kinase